jgi:hypothetical protein
VWGEPSNDSYMAMAAIKSEVVCVWAMGDVEGELVVVL